MDPTIIQPIIDAAVTAASHNPYFMAGCVTISIASAIVAALPKPKNKKLAIVYHVIESLALNFGKSKK